MRVLLAFAILVFAFAGIDSANARHGRYAPAVSRAAQRLVYDYEPGVLVRAYWIAPWRNRHYYPTTGEKPESGHAEAIEKDFDRAAKPAATFQRSWSTSTAVAVERPRANANSDSPDEEAEPPPQLPKIPPHVVNP